jgi:cytochrome c556
MRILSSVAILAVCLCVGCGSRDDNVQTPPAQAPAAAAPAPAAPAPAAAPAGGRAGGGGGAAQAGGRGGGAAAGARVTIAQHEATMKQIQQANGAMQKAAKAGDLMTVQTEAQQLATHFATAEQFWNQRKMAEPAKIAGAARQAAMDTVAAAKSGDAMKTQMAAGNVGGSCKQCHGMYREGDAKTGFQIRPDLGITD